MAEENNSYGEGGSVPSSLPPSGGGVDTWGLAIPATVRIRGDVIPHGGVVTYRVDEVANQPVRCELILANEAAPVGFGDEVEIFFSGADRKLFEGTVFGVGALRDEDASPQRRVIAYDGLAALDYARRSKRFEDKALSEVLEDIADEHHFSHEISVVGETVRQRVQANETDLEFAVRLAVEGGAEIWFEDGWIYASKVLDRPGYYLSLDAEQHFISFDVCADLSGQTEKLVFAGWKDDDFSEINEEAGSLYSLLGDGGEGSWDILREVGLDKEPARETVIHTVP